MSKSQTLRVLVNARLTAAAEEIFALFERTIVTFEEELRRCKEENQMKGAEPHEHHIKQEEHSVSVSECSSVRVKREESSLLQQTECREEPQGEEPHLHPETKGEASEDNDEDWRAPFSCSGAQMETDAAENKHRSESETSATANNGDVNEKAEGAEEKRAKCAICHKTYKTKHHLKIHTRVHTGERPCSCPVCGKGFAVSSTLKLHMRTHTGERPFICSFCGKTFSQRTHLNKHTRVHTGDRPYSCSDCGKTFSNGSNLKKHLTTTHRTKDFTTQNQMM